jgi:hypothetical protein
MRVVRKNTSDSGRCPFAVHGISGVETAGSVTRGMVR